MLPDNYVRLKQELEELGWLISNKSNSGYNNTAVFDVEVNIGVHADCVLYVNDKAIAIIEVIQNSKTDNLLNGLEQAKKYAYNYNIMHPGALGNPIPFIFAYNGKQIIFRDLKDKNSNPKDIKRFYSMDELLKMLYTIPYGSTNVTNNIDIFLKYLKFAIILIHLNASDIAIKKYFESRFSEDKFYVVGNNEYGIKRVLQLAYYLFTEIYLLNPKNDIFGINNKLLKDINVNDFSNIKINLYYDSAKLMNIAQGKRIIKDNSNNIIVQYSEGFVRDAESYAIPIYEKFKNSGEQFIKFGIKFDKNENSNFLYKLVKKLNSDKPTQIDYLNREPDAIRLSSFIANKNTQTPFNLAIISSWGNGKSSFVNFMIHHLDAINSSFSWKNKFFCKDKCIDNAEYKKINIIKFNAWQYNNDDQIGYNLADTVYSKLNILDKFILKYFNFTNILGVVVLFILVSVIYCILQFKILSVNELKDNINVLSLIVGGGILAFILNIFKGIINEIGEIISFKYSKIYKENIDIKYKIKNKICNYIRKLNKKKKRTVIFIDDLDRCSEQSIISLLDALILYLADECDIVVVLNVDISVILNAINSKLNNNNKVQAIKYLDKIIQANYNIPKILSDDYGNIINKLLPLQSEITNITHTDNRNTNGNNYDDNNDINLKENNKLVIEKEEENNQDKNNFQDSPSPNIQELPNDIIEELEKFLQDYGEIFEYNPRKIKKIINILKLLINDLKDNNIEFNSQSIVIIICILENYPEISSYISRQFDNNLELNIDNIDNIDLDNLKNNSKISDLLNENLSLIDKTIYNYIRKYIYDLSVINF